MDLESIVLYCDFTWGDQRSLNVKLEKYLSWFIKIIEKGDKFGQPQVLYESFGVTQLEYQLGMTRLHPRSLSLKVHKDPSWFEIDIMRA